MNTSFCIDAVTLREIRLSLVEPFRTSSGEVRERRILLLEIHDRDGATAWSECVALESPDYLPETIDTAALTIRDWVAPRVLGESFAHPGAVKPLLDQTIRGNNMAKAAIEMGAWILAAQKAGVSLSRLLGGTREKVATGIAIGIQESPEALIEKTRQALEEGYARIKIKIKPGADIEYLRPVCEAIGEGGRFMADANSAYTLDDIDLFRAMDELGLMMFEQPLAWDDLIRHAELQKELRTPICLDESILSLSNVEDMHRLGSGRVVNLKPGRVGGLAESQAIHDFCQEKGVPVWCGGMLETGIGRACNVALASLPNFTIAGDLSPSRRYWAEDIVDPEWDMDANGMVTVPADEPGLGVQINTARIDSITVRRESITQK